MASSPFYDYVVNPLCQKLIDQKYIPRTVSPDLLSLSGLLCACAAVLTTNSVAFGIPLAIFLWILYGLFDNLDGKQARVLKVVSPAGDFLDHAIDALVASLSALLVYAFLAPLPLSCGSKLRELLVVSAQLAILVGFWAHLVLGRPLLGTALKGKDYFTVDEVNFIVIPFLGLLRMIIPKVIDSKIDWTKQITSSSIGELIVVGLVLFAIISSAIVVVNVKTNTPSSKNSYNHVLVTAFAFTVKSAILLPPLMVEIPHFALIAFEILALRLRPESSCPIESSQSVSTGSIHHDNRGGYRILGWLLFSLCVEVVVVVVFHNRSMCWLLLSTFSWLLVGWRFWSIRKRLLLIKKKEITS